jgi:hypothetical protein
MWRHETRGINRMPSGQTAWAELLSGKRARSKGSLDDLQRKLWKAIRALDCGLDDAMQRGDGDEIRKYTHCLTQMSSVYLKLVMDADVERRLQILEARFSAKQP